MQTDCLQSEICLMINRIQEHMIRRICVVTPYFPTEKEPYLFPFVDQLVCALADQGIEVSVITPHDALKEKEFKDSFWTRKTPLGKSVPVYSPAVLTMTTRKLGFLNMSLISEKLFNSAVRKTIRKNGLKPDLLYAHFLFPAGTCAAAVGKKLGIPSVCAFGESSLWSIREIGPEGARKRLSSLSGVIAVSTNNKNVLIENKLVPEEKITVIPNAVNKKIFRPGDRKETRKKLGLPEDGVIGIYNGSFNKDKGSLRVSEAAEDIEGLSMIYLGGGKDVPQGSNILFQGRVAHEDVSTWLQAADFFVLPTLAEGCCNAIVEAMSTGLPIITSDKPFNYDILDHESGVLVDPMNIAEIHTAMVRMTESEKLRKKLGEASLKKSEDLDINKRAERIIAYLETVKKSLSEQNI